MINTSTADQEKTSHSILSFSGNATLAYRYFSKEDFLLMMSEMRMEDIMLDLERFKDLEEYEICQKIQFVVEEKRNTEILSLNSLMP
jgi:hypothetical protein